MRAPIGASVAYNRGVERTNIGRADTVRLDQGDARPASAEEPGPRYELVRALGEGGMGRVEHARDRDLRRDVAVKLLRTELLGDAAMLDQFLWEARVTAHLDHPNIVPVHDVGRLEENVFFTMKLVRGATLESAVSAATPIKRRLRLFHSICNAVAFAHARGVLHRDLKPSNVMVGEFGEVLVTDWGLALPLDTDAGRAIAALMPASLRAISAGTPAYMSPEQARGEPLDERSDVFSLGVMLYELVALAPPFQAESAPALLAKVLRGDARPLRDAVPDVSSSIVAVVEKAMATDRDARYASVAALADDVERLVDDLTPAAEHASMLTRAARWYAGRDPKMSRLRVMDVDVMVGGGFFMGLGIAVLFFRGTSDWVGWAWMAAGVLAWLPPMARWFARRDPSAR